MHRSSWIILSLCLCLSLLGCQRSRSASLFGWWSSVSLKSASARSPLDATGSGRKRAAGVGTSWFVEPQALSQKPPQWKPTRCQHAIPHNWFAKASLLAGRDRLKTLLRKHKVRIPWGTHMLVSRLLPGVGQPSFIYESYGDTGFVHSKGRFWPASTVKLMAAVGALVRLHKYGLDGDTLLEFRDNYGRFRGSLYRLYKRAIGMSTNLDYDRLVRVATQIRLNREILHPRFGMPLMSIRSAFSGSGKLAYSPEIRYRQGKKQGVLPARQAPKNNDMRCPYSRNCATLFELQEGLRRVMLHYELPKSERFALPSKDIKRLHDTLLAAWSGIFLTVREEWGKQAKIWNKGGLYRPQNHLENAYIEGPQGQRLFVTISIPFTRYRPRMKQTTALLQYLSRGILRSYDALAGGPPLQADAGYPMEIKLERRPHGHGVLQIQTNTHVDKALVWQGRHKREARLVGPGQFVVPFDWPSSTQEVFVVQGFVRGKLESYRSILVRRPGVWLPPCQ